MRGDVVLRPLTSDDLPVFPVCWVCRHAHDNGKTCEAFPEGIPEEIRHWGNSHIAAFPGDRGIRFEVIPGREADADYLVREQAAWKERRRKAGIEHQRLGTPRR